MAMFRIAAIFKGGGAQAVGWSEIYYREAGSLSAAASFTGTLWQNRANMLQTLYTLVRLRISDVDQPRVTATTTLNLPGNYGASAQGLADPADSIVYRLSSTIVPATRLVFFRGLDKGSYIINATTGAESLNPYFQAAANSFVASLGAAGCGIFARVRPTSGVQWSKQDIVDLSPAPNPKQTVVTHNPISIIPIGSNIIIGRTSAKDAPGLNGQWRVRAYGAAGNNRLIIDYELPQNAAVVGTKGYLRLYNWLTGTRVDPAVSGFAFVSTRRTRSPFSGSRGSRRSPLRGLRQSP